MRALNINRSNKMKNILSASLGTLLLCPVMAFAGPVGFGNLVSGMSAISTNIECTPFQINQFGLTLSPNEMTVGSPLSFFGQLPSSAESICTVTIAGYNVAAPHGWTEDKAGVVTLAFTQDGPGYKVVVKNANLQAPTNLLDMSDNELLKGKFSYDSNGVPGIYFTSDTYHLSSH